MDQKFVLYIFEFVVLIFAFSIHEAAHAWTAARLGDPTAMMLGRVTLNPMKHIVRQYPVADHRHSAGRLDDWLGQTVPHHAT
jgi:hypothetical protein